MSTDDITEGLNNIMRRDAMVAGTEFLPDNQPYTKDDVVQRVLANKKGGAPIKFEPMTEEDFQTQAGGQIPQFQFKAQPSQSVGGNVPTVTQVPTEKVSAGRMTRKNTTTGGDIVSVLLTIRNQVKLYHWQTKSYADHKATDDLTAALDTAIDTFVEVYMGKYGRPRVTKAIKLHNFSGNMAREFVTKQTVYLLNVLPRKLKKTDTDLLNIRDEILAELNKIRYLFTLN